MAMTSLHGRSIFCDDIRFEIGNKISYIGVYQDSLVVERFPATLARLCISIWVGGNVDLRPENIDVSVFQADEELAHATFELNPSEERRVHEKIRRIHKQFHPRCQFDEDEDPQYQFLINPQFNLSPLPLHEACRIRVRAKADDEEIRAGSLLVLDRKTQDAIDEEMRKAFPQK